MNLDRRLAWLWSRPPALATALLTGLLAVAPGAQDLPRAEPSQELDDETPPTTPEILGTQESSPSAFEARLSALLGLRFLSDSHVWDGEEGHVARGLDFSLSWPLASSMLGFEVGLGQSSTIDLFDNDSGGKMREVYGGIRWTTPRSHQFRPYIGAGATSIRAKLEVSEFSGDEDDKDTTGGLYVHAGLLMGTSKGFAAGVDLRLVTGTDIELVGENGDANYFQVALVLSWGF